MHNATGRQPERRDIHTAIVCLQVPAELLANPKASDLAWSGVLCCVVTRVTLWDEKSIMAYKQSGIKLPTRAARLVSSSNEDDPKLYAEKASERREWICPLEWLA